MKLSSFAPSVAPSVVTASAPRATASSAPSPASQARSGYIYKNSSRPLKEKGLESFLQSHFPQRIFGDSVPELRRIVTPLLQNPDLHLNLLGNLVSFQIQGRRGATKTIKQIALPTLQNKQTEVPAFMTALRSHVPSETHS
jgi:hypothetical protein